MGNPLATVVGDNVDNEAVFLALSLYHVGAPCYFRQLGAHLDQTVPSDVLRRHL